MYLTILVIRITELITVSNREDNYCMNDCNSERQPSLYEQHCCNLTNIGNTIHIEKANRLTFIICPSNIPNTCFQFNKSSCADIYKANPDPKSGYYNITLTNGSIVTVYCDMEGINCDEEGGWTRVAYLNMTEPGTTCPSGLTRYSQYIDISHDVCGQSNTSSGGCDSTFFSTYSVNYTKVCGQVRGYQYHSPDAFKTGTSDINSYYVDGVSITYGSNQHIWTYAAGLIETHLSSSSCPCSSGNSAIPPPSFVGNDYYCESGLNAKPWSPILYANDRLWDRQNCNGPESTLLKMGCSCGCLYLIPLGV